MGAVWTGIAGGVAAAGWEVWRGLALNPNTQPGVMERLAKSRSPCTRMNLTYNPATPAAIWERLAKDPDELLARNARLAVGRRSPAIPHQPGAIPSITICFN